MAIKKNALWVGAVLIFVMSAIAFVFIPSSRGFGNQKTLVFGKWNKKSIEYVQDSFFIRQIQNISEQYRSQGQELDQFAYFQVMHSAFNSTVIRYAIQDELEKVQYEVPTFLVNKNLVNYYLDSDGKYSANLYEQTPETTRVSRRKQLTEDLTVQRYISDIFGTQSGLYGIKTSGAEANFIKSMASPERSFSYVAFETSTYPDSEVARYAQENPNKFVKYPLLMISLDSEADAKRVASSISKEEITFEDAIATYSTHYGTSSDGVLTGDFAYQLETFFTDAKDLELVKSLSVNAISPIVKAGSSFAIVKKIAQEVQADLNDTEIIGSVKSYMRSNELGRIQDYHLAQAEEFVKKARESNFAQVAEDYNIAVQTTASFTINYGGSDILSTIPAETNPELASANKNEAFFKEAFTLEAGAISNPLMLDSYIVVLKLLEEKASDQDNNEMIPYFYKYYAMSWAQDSLSNEFLQSDKLEDNFIKVYLENFLN